MEEIKNVKTAPLQKSNYLQMYRMHYEQDGKAKTWDIAKSHDSVAILIHNVTRDAFVFVRQFRPAVYLNKACQQQGKALSAENPPVLDTALTPGSEGVTYELCAGIVDKERSLIEIAQEEVLEETGYHVSVDSLEKIFCGRSSVGVSGSQMTLYYVCVTDEMRKSPGGGCAEEGEFIEVVEIPVKDSLTLAWDESIEKPTAMVFAILWFHQFKSDAKL